MFINGDISVDDLGALFTIFDFNIDDIDNRT